MRARRKTQLTVLCVLLVGTACRPSTRTTSTASKDSKEFVEQVGDDVMLKDLKDEKREKHDRTYQQVPDAEADAIVIVTINIPGLAHAEDYRVPLKKNSHPRTPGINPIGVCRCADGISQDGHGIGHVGSIVLCSGSETHITVKVSVAGTSQEGREVLG